MYSGFVTHKNVIKRVGIHQRFDMAAYHMIEPFLPSGDFPELADILHFEGYNGPDGLKVKSPDLANPSHFYDPVTDTGEVPAHITNHYNGLVQNLKSGDLIRAAFEAAWMAHYVCDGLTPAHHFPFEERLESLQDDEIKAIEKGDINAAMKRWRRRWETWGAKGLLSTHFNFEMGIAFALVVFPIRPEFSESKLAEARGLGYLDFFKSEARDVATLDLYHRFYDEGWNSDIATIVKNKIAPQTATAIGLIWLLAFLEAGQQLAIGN